MKQATLDARIVENLNSTKTHFVPHFVSKPSDSDTSCPKSLTGQPQI